MLWGTATRSESMGTSTRRWPQTNTCSRPLYPVMLRARSTDKAACGIWWRSVSVKALRSRSTSGATKNRAHTPCRIPGGARTSSRRLSLGKRSLSAGIRMHRTPCHSWARTFISRCFLAEGAGRIVYRNAVRVCGSLGPTFCSRRKTRFLGRKRCSATPGPLRRSLQGRVQARGLGSRRSGLQRGTT